MLFLFELVFWLSAAAVFHSYVLYPIILQILTWHKKENEIVFCHADSLPEVSVLMAAFNEEKVIAEKLESIFETNYPLAKLTVYVGSDNSTDKTNKIIGEFQKRFPENLFFTAFTSRQGKGNIINQLYDKTSSPIIILTDANVIFSPYTIYELVKHFKNEAIGLVDANMINKGMRKEGISIQENAYISHEVMVKHREGILWGTMMGPFGGCYAIRNELFTKVPPTFLVDDFYINMKVLTYNNKAINNLQAKVYEDVSNNLSDEFRRKVRIATGNFQNLQAFFSVIFPFRHMFGNKNKSLNISLLAFSFSFVSHKVIRWLGPFYFFISLLSLFALSVANWFYFWCLACYLLTLVMPIADYLLRKISIHLVLLRFITHFYSMNLALLLGFYNYLKGVKSNVWQPTKRHQ